MATIEAQVLIPSGTGIPADRSQHTWTVTALSSSEAVTDAVLVALEAFYDTTPTGGTASIASRMRDGIVSNPWTVRFLTVTEATGERTPLREGTFSVTLAASGETLPSEVAVRASIHGDLTGVQAVDRRRRGGPFMGPGLIATVATIASNRVLVDEDFQTDLALAIGELDAALAADTIALAIYSQPDAASHGVTGWFVDNAFDTIRSRGTTPTARISGPA